MLGLSSALPYTNYANQGIQSQFQQFRQQFQQLGQDLQSGSLSAAQTDFASLQQLQSSSSASSALLQASNPASQDFTQLAQDLKAGNLTAAQQDYKNMQADFQAHVPQWHAHRHHSHMAGVPNQSNPYDQNGQSTNGLAQLLGASTLSVNA